MKAEDVIKQLRVRLPQFTDLFGDLVSVASMTAAGTTVTITTSSPHGMKVGEFFSVAGAESPVAVSSLTQTDGVLSLTTASPHDVTKNDAENFIPKIKIYGADQTEYNGEYDITRSGNVPNRVTVEGLNVVDTAVSPATGQIFLDDGKDRGYNGRFEVTSVADPTTLTFESQNDLTGSPQAFGDIKLARCMRISGAVSLEVAQQAYTKQEAGNFWAYVVLDDVEVSKDRNVENDASSNHADGNEFRLQTILPFAVYVFAPVSAEISARAARDLMQDEVFMALNRSLLRTKFPAPVCEEPWSGVTLIGHGFEAFEEAYYIHSYRFEQLIEVTYNDTVTSRSDVAFRDICGDFDINELDEDIDITFGANLDDRPQ